MPRSRSNDPSRAVAIAPPKPTTVSRCVQSSSDTTRLVGGGQQERRELAGLWVFLDPRVPGTLRRPVVVGGWPQDEIGTRPGRVDAKPSHLGCGVSELDLYRRLGGHEERSEHDQAQTPQRGLIGEDIKRFSAPTAVDDPEPLRHNDGVSAQGRRQVWDRGCAEPERLAAVGRPRKHRSVRLEQYADVVRGHGGIFSWLLNRGPPMRDRPIRPSQITAAARPRTTGPERSDRR